MGTWKERGSDTHGFRIVSQEGTPHPLHIGIAWRDNHAEFTLTTAFPFVIPNLITRVLRNKLPRRVMDPAVRLNLIDMEQDF